MDTLVKPTIQRNESISDSLSRFFPIVCAETFIGEDAAEAIRAFDPLADVRVVTSNEDAQLLIAARGHVTAVLAISPREPLGPTPLVAQLRDQNATLMVITTAVATLGDIPCRTLTADLPFTNETISDLLRRMDENTTPDTRDA